MKKLITDIREMKDFLLLWLTQSFSGFGSAVTGYALVIWSYTQQGSALTTALLLYALCAVQHLCRRAQRPLGQEKDHAGL